MFAREKSARDVLENVMSELGNTSSSIQTGISGSRLLADNIPYYFPAGAKQGLGYISQDIEFGVGDNRAVDLALYLGYLNSKCVVMMSSNMEKEFSLCSRMEAATGRIPCIFENVRGQERRGKLKDVYSVDRGVITWHDPLPEDFEFLLAALIGYNVTVGELSKTSGKLGFSDFTFKSLDFFSPVKNVAGGADIACMVKAITEGQAEMSALAQRFEHQTYTEVSSFVNAEYVFASRYLQIKLDAVDANIVVKNMQEDIATLKIALMLLNHAYSAEHTNLKPEQIRLLDLFAKNPAKLEDRKIGLDTYRDSIDKIASLCEALDMRGMIQAYRAGVPIEDIVA